MTSDNPEARARRARWVVVAIVLVMSVVVFVLATRPSSTSRQGESPVVGNQVPNITGTTIDGETFELATFRDKWLLINVFATWCGPCIQEHPDLVEFASRQRGDVQVIGIVFKDDAQNVRDFRARNGGNWPMVLDQGGAAAISLGIRGVPESLLISPEGVIVAKIVGGVTLAKLDELLARSSGL